MATRQRQTFGRDVLEALQSVLDSAPATPPKPTAPTSLTKQALVRELAPKLREMHKRGWSWADLASVMAKQVALSPELLSAYLRGKPKASGKSAKKRPEVTSPANKDAAVSGSPQATIAAPEPRELARAAAVVIPAAAPPKPADGPANETPVADKDVLDDEDQWAAEPTAVGGARR